MAEYSAAEHFNNPSRQRVPLVEFTLPLEPTATRQAGGNVIQKTTSETLRLTDQLHPNQVGPSSTVDIKKTCSFQITSVRVSSSISNDGEDDSCGEVDDTLTEPSEVGSHNHIDVEEDIETGMENVPSVMYVSNVPVSLAQQQVIEGSALKLEDKDQGLHRRFRVVKIESAEPFKRGRWLCMDFLDQPSIQPILSKDEPGSAASSSGSLSDHISSDDVQHHAPYLQQPNQTLQSISTGTVLNSCNQQASSSIHVVPHSLPASAASVSYPPALQQPMYQKQSSAPLGYSVASVTTILQPTAATIATTSNTASLAAIPLVSSQSTPSVSAGATLPGPSSNVAQPFLQQPAAPGLLQQQQSMTSQAAYTASTVAPQQQQYVTSAPGIQPAMTAQHLPSQQPIQQATAAQIPVIAQQNLMPMQSSSSSNVVASSAHPLAATLIPPSSTIPTQANQNSMHPVALLPSSASLQQPSQPTPVTPNHGPPPGLIPQHPHPPLGLQSQQQQQQQQQQPGNQGQPTFAEIVANAPVQPLSSAPHLQQHAPQPTPSVQPIQAVGVASASTLQQSEVVMQQQQSVQQLQSMQQTHIQQSCSMLKQAPQQQPALAQQTTTPHVVYGGNSNNPTIPMAVESVATSIQPQVQTVMAAPSTLTTAIASSNSAVEAAMAALPHGPGVVNKFNSVVDDGHATTSTEDHASASGSSTVAIDNKIEQAMDLVKSHLMFAVREEVEVLKKRIDVFMERIAFLESENQILRASATQETLAQIAQLEVTFPVSGSDTVGSGSDTVGSGGSVSVVGVASSAVGPIVNNTITLTMTTPSMTTSCTSSQLASGTSPAP